MFLNLHALLKLSHSYISSIEEMVTVLSHYIYCTIHSEWHNIDNLLQYIIINTIKLLHEYLYPISITKVHWFIVSQ